MENKNLALLFLRLADALELKDENRFKIISYRKAAQVLEGLAADVREFYEKDKLRDIPGIGEGIEKKIKEYFEKGKISKLEEVTKELGPELIDLLRIPNLGPRTLALASRELKVKDLAGLEKAIRSGSLARLPLMGEKKVDHIRKGIDIYKRSRERMPLGSVYLLVDKIVKAMKGLKEVKSISPAGSFRRMKETIADIDILIAGTDPEKIMDHFISLSIVDRVLARGMTKSSILTRENVQVDLRVVDQASWGAALQYFTGSREHNVKLRGMAREMGLKINEYGVFRNSRMIAGRTEEEVYRTLKLDYIEPELREARGEIELASEHKLPDLLPYEDFPGEFHVHTDYSDGSATAEEMVKAGLGSGYRFIGLSDHSKSARYAG
ncbi:MAG: DNA polymerase III, partial [bacterium]|nr:DNA polymerase III [bacterium]